MKRYFMLILVLLLFLFSACVPERETSEAPLESTPDRITAPSEDPLATEEWENTTKENGNKVLRKYTKVYDGDKKDYTITAMAYIESSLVEKIITVYTDGKETHDETYKYDGDTLILCAKRDYDPKTSALVYSDTYEADQYDLGYAYSESRLHFSDDGYVTDGIRTYYAEGGSVLREEKQSVKELDGYKCSYTVVTYYDTGGKISRITHMAFDKNMEYSYGEMRTAEDEILYTSKKVGGVTTLFFPDVGGCSSDKTQWSFFTSDGVEFARARSENETVNIYEIAEGLTAQQAVDAANAILAKAREYGL